MPHLRCAHQKPCARPSNGYTGFMPTNVRFTAHCAQQFRSRRRIRWCHEPVGGKMLRTSWLTTAIFTVFACYGTAQTLTEQSSEARFQLDLHAPDAALMSYIPQGFTLNVA